MYRAEDLQPSSSMAREGGGGGGGVDDGGHHAYHQTDSSGSESSIIHRFIYHSPDPALYAYPSLYTPSITPMPASRIFNMVVRFGDMWAAAQQLSSSQDENDQQEQLDCDLKQLADSIIRRCYQYPQQVRWKDADSDTALHRLAQAARLHHKYDDLFTCFIRIANAILENDPDAMLRTNHWQQTPLHQLVFHGGMVALPDTIDDITDGPTTTTTTTSAAPATSPPPSSDPHTSPLFIFFSQLSHKGAVWIRNVWKATALHEACQCVASTIYDHTDPSSLTIHAAMIDHLIRIAPESLIQEDDSRSTPLHRYISSTKITQSSSSVACIDTITAGSTTSVSRVLPLLLNRIMEHHPSWLTVKCAGGGNTIGSPLSTLCSRYHATVVAKDNSIDSMSRIKRIQSGLASGVDPTRLRDELGDLWDMTLQLCYAQVHGKTEFPRSHSDNCDGLLSTLIAAECPWYCVLLAAFLYPAQLFQHSQQGETVLDRLLSKPSAYYPCASIQSSSRFFTLPDTSIPSSFWSALWGLSRDRSLLAFPSRRGRLPLHTAILQTCICASTSSAHSLLRDILWTEPSALLVPDPVTQLYPFQVMAAAKKIRKKEEEQKKKDRIAAMDGNDLDGEEKERQDFILWLLSRDDGMMIENPEVEGVMVTNIYLMLRAEPSVISHFAMVGK